MTLKYLMTLIQIFFFSSIVIFGGSAWAKNNDDLCKGKVVSAEVVAIEQAIVLNRYGAFNARYSSIACVFIKLEI